MNVFHILILSIVEGLTEFLPISSTAHLIIVSKLLNINQTNFIKLFEIFIQSGAILSVIFLYFKFLKKNKILIKYLFFSFLPTALFGVILHKIIKNVFFEAFNLIVFSLFFIGVLFVFLEMFFINKKIILRKELKNLNFLEALLIGFFQSLAIIPGVSRAGAIILGMILLGYKRKEATLYSFLLAVPTILAAGIFDFYKEREIVFSNINNLLILFLGFFVSFVFAYLSINWFIDFVKKKSLLIFGIYRILLAIIIFFLFF